MSYYTHLECTACSRTYTTDRWLDVCTCGRRLFARYDLSRIRGEVPRDAVIHRIPTMWRYREFLPFHPGETLVTMGEGRSVSQFVSDKTPTVETNPVSARSFSSTFRASGVRAAGTILRV